MSSCICLASHHASIADLLNDAEFRGLAGRDGFLIELRLDFYSDLNRENLDRALAVFAPACVVTCRHPDEGGKNAKFSDEQRLAFLQHAADAGVRYVDIEARTPRKNFRKGRAQLILSYHDFNRVPEQPALDVHWVAMSSDTDADVVKIVATPQTMLDGARLLNVMIQARESGRSAIVLGMGEFGFWTRVCGPLFNAPLTYARGEGAAGTAPGQLTWRQLEELYRFRQIRPDWPVYGVIGNPIGHSLSPLLHNTAFRELNLDGLYLPFKVDGDPVEFVRAFAPLGIRGLSVTIPHKETVGTVCADIDPIARAIGAVNTLVLRPDGSWFAANTDAFAAAKALEQASGTLQGKRVLILGAGGAARAVAFGVRELGATVLVANRTHERAVALARASNAQAVPMNQLATKNVDAIVNTTPLGMHPNTDSSPLEKDQIPQGSIVFDTVYNPLRTRLLNSATERGCKTVEGWVMFVGQGLRQFELWTGRSAPRERLEKVILNELKARQRG
jgi:3-dehydroquinate dehydratase/shikimate dehydrogenase